MSTIEIAIYGGGGFAREVAWLAQACNEEREYYRVACFIDDDRKTHGTTLKGIPVMGLEEVQLRFPLVRIVAGIGSPQSRQKVMERAASLGFNFATVIHPRTERSQWIEIGEGTVICAGNILTTDITLGKFVQLNLDCTIGHDVIMGDYTTLAPGVHVSGCVHFGKCVYVGTGAVIINGTQDNPISVGDDAVIGAGACVTQSIPAFATAVGVPARVIKIREA